MLPAAPSVSGGSKGAINEASLSLSVCLHEGAVHEVEPPHKMETIYGGFGFISNNDTQETNETRLDTGCQLMNEAQKRNITLSEEARHFANVYVHSVQLQISRIRQPPTEEFPLASTVDFEFLLISLRKLRRAAELVQRIPPVQLDMDLAIKRFDSALPYLAVLRNASEHFDEHLEGRDRGKCLVQNYPSSFSTFLESKGGYVWLNKDINFQDCLNASGALFDAVRNANRKIAVDAGITLDVAD